MAQQEVTESWREKNYEEQLTEFYFRIITQMKNTQLVPVQENLKIAFSCVKSFSYALIYSAPFLKKFKENVKPVLEDIEKILYGNSSNIEVMRLCKKYKVQILADRKKKNTYYIGNGQNILNELWEILFLIKQWGYAQGFFAKKPYERRYGKDAIRDVMGM